MPARKSTPNLMDQLVDLVPAVTEGSKPVYQNTGIPEHQHTSFKSNNELADHENSFISDQLEVSSAKPKKPAHQNTSNPVHQHDGEKSKATFYLSEELIDDLEAAWLKLRKLVGKEERTAVSKSLIVDIALQEIIRDLNNNGSNSILAKEVKLLGKRGK